MGREVHAFHVLINNFAYNPYESMYLKTFCFVLPKITRKQIGKPTFAFLLQIRGLRFLLLRSPIHLLQCANGMKFIKNPTLLSLPIGMDQEHSASVLFSCSQNIGPVRRDGQMNPITISGSDKKPDSEYTFPIIDELIQSPVGQNRDSFSTPIFINQGCRCCLLRGKKLMNDVTTGETGVENGIWIPRVESLPVPILLLKI